MTLPPGHRFGPFQVTAKLGEGGMGVVYRATDSHLGREVALKVLPERFTADPERTARFAREAKLLAQLNHPHIAQIYGLEASGSTRAFVMELVEGPTLAERLEGGSLPLDEVFSIARQIADALEDAHGKGIIHRDLKPQNIKAPVDGQVKVLDFGLAKALDPVSAAEASPSVLAHSPTVTFQGTREGVILGTAAYMSPEQATGGGVDQRSDIWSFGVVLYEMLTRRRLFDGESVSHVLASVLQQEPDLSVLPAATPTRIVNLLRRCLRKKPRQRLQAIGDARVVLEEVLADPQGIVTDGARAAPADPSHSTRLAWVAAAVGLGAAALFAALWLGTDTEALPARAIQAALPGPEGTVLGDSFALSPDGRRIVFQAFDQESGLQALWLRDLERGEARRLVTTGGGEMPIWSPDGAQIGFFADGKLQRLDTRGGPAQVICDAPTPRGGAWGPDDRIVFSPSFRAGLSIVSASGGRPASLTTLDEARGEKSHRFPRFLPGGRRLVFLAQTAEGGTKGDTSRIEALDLASGRRTPLVTVNSSPLFAPPNHLLFWRDGVLLEQELETSTLRVGGDDPVPVFAPVAFDQNEHALASVADDGTLVLREGLQGTLSSMVVLDRDGGARSILIERENLHAGLAVSHDGSRVAVPVYAPGQGGKDLWIIDVERGVTSRLTFAEGNEWAPNWASDDRSIYYVNDHLNDGVIFRRAADGAGGAQEIGTSDPGVVVDAVSRDGRWLVVEEVVEGHGLDLFRFDVDGGARTPLVTTAFQDSMAELSPDDRLLAYASDESGRREVYVQALDGERGRWQISSGGGETPHWSADGRELFFFSPPDRLLRVAVESGEVPRFSAPQQIFRHPLTDYDVFPDGRRFAVMRHAGGSSGKPLTLITSWTARLARR